MSAVLTAPSAWAFGIAPTALRKLQRLFERMSGLERVWIYGSRARGHARLESDIDLAVDCDVRLEACLREAIEDLGLLYEVELVNLRASLAAEFRQRIERDRRVCWERAAA